MKRNLILISTGVLAMAGAITGGYLYWRSQQTSLPASIKQQLNFTPITPPQAKITENTHLDTDSYKYDSKNQILSYVVNRGKTEITFAEQPYPEALIFDKLVGTMNQYAEIQTRLGKVALTRPNNADGDQAAVFSNYNGSSGILLFARANEDLTNAQWQELFNNLAP